MNHFIWLCLISFLVTATASAQQTGSSGTSLNQRLDPNDCKILVEKILELRLNGSTNANLNAMLQVISGECQLTPRTENFNFEPVLYKFSQSDFKILWDGKRFYFNEKAQMTVDHTMPAAFQNVVWVTSDQIITRPIAESLEIARKTDPAARDRLGAFDRLVFEMNSVRNRLKYIEREGRLRLQVSGYAYHDRRTYDREKIKQLNERAWGLGIEKLLYTDESHRESVNTLWITDSHSDPQFSFAYEWQKMFYKSGSFEVWAGVSAGLVLRSDFKYSPIPFALPTVAFSYGSVILKFVAIPSVGGVNNGNVLFGLISVAI